MKKLYVKIDGIHCNHCVTKITNALLKNKKINKVDIYNNIAHISYEGNLKKEEIIDTITSLDYITNEDYISSNLKEINNKINLIEFLIILISILLIAFLLNKIFGFNIFNIIPTIDSSITYGMLFITGLLTSIHCISMCGAINLVAVTSSKRDLKRPLLYNLGRLISYTLIGGIIGLIGSFFTVSNTLSGIIIVLAAIIMLLMSLSMLGIINFKLPSFAFKAKANTSSSFIVGLLNGLMPCGPLQAMQLYALSTGSFITGALSMFLFCLGTIPLMLLIGFIINAVKGRRKIIINKIASVLILVLSLVMLNRGLLSFGIDITKFNNNYGNYKASVLEDNIQIIEFELDYNNYEDIILQKDIPVKMIIHVDKKYLTGCNNEIIINEFNISKKLEVGDNIIEFTPTETGDYVYTCWMNMIKNNIKVIDDRSYFKED